MRARAIRPSRTALARTGIDLRTRKDHVVFERDEVLTAGGTPFSVFTPYKNAWLKKVTAADLAALPVEALSLPASRRRPPHGAVCRGSRSSGSVPPTALDLMTPGMRGAHQLLAEFLGRIDRYADARDFPAVRGPSYLSVHLRFGTISIRELARAAYERMRAGSRGAAVWLSELIWRDFYHQVLHHHPHVVERAFRREYDAIEWEQGERAQQSFAAWCEGRTGYPLVDAAMRAAQSNGLHAQPAAHGHGELLDQGLRVGLAPR